MPLENLHVLLLEIERQLEYASDLSQQTPHVTNHGAEELVIEDHNYYHDLNDLYKLFDRNDKAVGEDIMIPPNCQNCLWKLLASSNSSSPVLNPEHQQTRCRNIQEIRREYGLNGGSTEDMWQAKSVQIWTTSVESSVIIVQGNSQTMGPLGQFSYEISRHFGEIYPTIWVLSEPSSRGYFATNDETEVLRQLAIQALRQIPHFKLSFLINILCLFKECATSHDWFKILKIIFQLIPKVYVVVDLSVLGSRINHAKGWPRDFQALISQLNNSCSSRLGVMLLSSRLLSFENSNAPVVLVTSEPQCRKRPYEDFSTNSARRVSKFVSVDERDSGLVNCNPKPALGEEHAAHCLIYGGSARNNLHDQSSNDILGDSYFNRRGTDKVPKHAPNSSSTSTSPFTLPRRSDISIAVICALALEADAVLAVFDQHWDIRAFGNLEGDKNAYSVGRIGCHNVVLVHMPGIGKAPAATVAASCRTSFPGIGLALVVGICGAAPHHRRSTEVLLGDVIISDRLIIYDFGRQFPDTFMRKETTLDSARKPPEEIRSFLAKMKVRRSQRILHERTVFHLKALQQNGHPPYPGVEEDRLFEPSYRHKHQRPSECAQCACLESPNGLVCNTARISTCDTLGCDLSKLVTRQRHSQTINELRNCHPMLHFGSYASGDTVMKSGEHRDQIAEREEVIAFEMEGAGVWEIFPCVIIKGVCDYADSHKNKKWQDYSATTAAACSKALLEAWPPRDSSLNP